MVMVTMKRALLIAAILAFTNAAGADAGGRDAARSLPLVACVCKAGGAAATHAGPLARGEHCPRLNGSGSVWLMRHGVDGAPCRQASSATLRLIDYSAVRR